MVLLSVLALMFGCTSESESPLGSQFVDDGLIGVDPGDVFEDTIVVSSGDTSFAVGATLTTGTEMFIGRRNGVETSMLIRYDFAASANPSRTVQSAILNMRLIGTQTDSINAQFFKLDSLFDESEAMTALAFDPTPIPDDVGGVDRLMANFPRTYSLPPALVQSWIDGSEAHNGMAIVMQDAQTSAQVTYGTRENGETSLESFVQVNFTDGTSEPFFAVADGSFAQNLTASSNLRLSDGPSHRIFIPMDISGISPDALLHNATLTLSLVSGSSTLGSAIETATLYTPNSSDITNADVLKGDVVSIALLDDADATLTFTVLEAVNDYLAAVKAGNPPPFEGLVLRLTLEGQKVQGIEFYGGAAAPDLRPRFTFTFSNPPDFP